MLRAMDKGPRAGAPAPGRMRSPWGPLAWTTGAEPLLPLRAWRRPWPCWSPRPPGAVTRRIFPDAELGKHFPAEVLAISLVAVHR
eukprot:3746388-Lingulodinium_polyedra.AAC.1